VAGQIGRLLQALTSLSARLGMCLLIAAVLATTADVLARKLAGFTYAGTIDVVQLLVLAAAYLAIPHAFMIQSHVAVGILVDRFGVRGQALSSLLGAVLGMLLLASFAWFGAQQALMQIDYGDASQTVGIPMVWFWLPLLYGCALSALVCLRSSVRATQALLTGRSARPC